MIYLEYALKWDGLVLHFKVGSNQMRYTVAQKTEMQFLCDWLQYGRGVNIALLRWVISALQSKKAKF